MKINGGHTIAIGVLFLALCPASHANLAFNFIPANGTSQQAIDGFTAAGARWSSYFGDNVTVNINISFTALGPGILGSTSSTQGTISYASTRLALIDDETTVDDIAADVHLQVGPGLKLYLNRTSNSPNSSGSATPFLDNDGDANNTTIRMTLANAKALSLWPANDPTIDASISFSTSFTWDFDPSNGITPGAYDFVGVATHEIGHALGFISGVDVLDGNSPPINGPFADNVFTYVSTPDLFRFSAASITNGNGTIDWTADTRDKYFSLDGGTTKIASFATGLNFGDGRQASHWKDNLGLGIMDPTAATGELLSISSNDLRLFDVIGWDAVPEPTTVCLWLGGTLLIGCLRRRTARR